MRRRTSQAGFTFLELIACLAIISILASLLFPMYLRARESARRTSCASNLQQLGTSLHLYSQDHDGRFPPEDNAWAEIAGSYVKNFSVFKCPCEPPSVTSRFKTSGSWPRRGRSWISSSYQYRAGYSNDDWSELPIAGDWDGWHQHGGNVLRLGGSVRWEEGPVLPLTKSSRPQP